MNKATRGRSVGKDGTGEGRGKNLLGTPQDWPSGWMDGLRRWAGVDHACCFFLQLFFFVITGEWKKQKENRSKGCGWLVNVAAGTEDNEDSKGRGPTGGRWPVVGGGH